MDIKCDINAYAEANTDADIITNYYVDTKTDFYLNDDGLQMILWMVISNTSLQWTYIMRNNYSIRSN